MFLEKPLRMVNIDNRYFDIDIEIKYSSVANLSVANLDRHPAEKYVLCPYVNEAPSVCRSELEMVGASPKYVNYGRSTVNKIIKTAPCPKN